MRKIIGGCLMAAALLWSIPGTATAGPYNVKLCEGGTNDLFFNPGFTYWETGSFQRDPGSGCGGAGFLAARINATRLYNAASAGGYRLNAPSGTVFTSASGLFGTIVGGATANLVPQGWVYENANLTGDKGVLFFGDLGNGSWSEPKRYGWNSLASGHVGRMIDFVIGCFSNSTCQPGANGDVRLRGGSFELTLDDQVDPSPNQVGGSLFDGGWRRGSQTASFRATDAGSGLDQLTARFSNVDLTSPAGCQKVGGFYGAPTPCPLDRTHSWTIDTAQLFADGEHSVYFKAQDVGGRVAASSARTFKVDNHAPAAPLSPALAGGSGWRATNGFDISWVNPVQEHAPITTAHWRACPAGQATGCSSGDATGLTSANQIKVPAPGEWDVRVWLEDAAGNATPVNSSAPLRVRWDPEAPVLTFQPPDPEQPTLAAVEARDRSGLTGGTIEVSRVGGAGWQTLHTVRRGNRLEAAIPDEQLPAGDYELRAHGTDAAGNEGAAYGSPRALPIRFETRMKAAALTRVRIKTRRCGTRGHRRCRTKQVGKSAIRVAYGKRIKLAGNLTTRDGQRLHRRPVEVVFVPNVGPNRRLTATRTDDSGSIRYPLKATRNGVIVFRYAGDRRILPSQQRVRVAVPAPVSIHTRNGLLFNGEAATFTGRVRGGSIPAAGKLIEIQAYFRRAWRTISTTRSNRRGNWRFTYTFGGTTGTVRYRFRARVPAESGYPFATGASKTAKVTVRGL